MRCIHRWIGMHVCRCAEASRKVSSILFLSFPAFFLGDGVFHWSWSRQAPETLQSLFPTIQRSNIEPWPHPWCQGPKLRSSCLCPCALPCWILPLATRTYSRRKIGGIQTAQLCHGSAIWFSSKVLISRKACAAGNICIRIRAFLWSESFIWSRRKALENTCSLFTTSWRACLEEHL